MTCQECELGLASEDQVDVSDHLAACAACRELALDLRANSHALREFANEPMPMIARPRPVRWQWAAVAAIAAMIALMLFLPKPAAVAPPVIPDVVAARSVDPVMPPPRRVEHRRVRRQAVPHREPQILQVKMLTSDPDVVIYWQVSN